MHANRSIRNVHDVFSVTYLDRPIPSLRTIFKIISKFNNHGCVEYTLIALQILSMH
jgi:hypothetical protein